MNDQLKKKLEQAEIEAIKRLQQMDGGKTIPCESSVCNCPARKQIGVNTMSVVVTPQFGIQLVCQYGAERFAMIHNTPLNK